jgi:hypothetical protein
MRTSHDDPVGAEVLRAVAANRERAARLRAHSADVRARSEQRRNHNEEVRARTWVLFTELVTRSTRDMVMRHPVADSRLQAPDGEVTTAELWDILVDHHGFDTHEAMLLLAVEMEVAGYSLDRTSISGPEALDLVQAVLDRRGQ